MKKMRTSISKAGGQSFTEFALALPIMLLLMFGVIEMARLIQAWLAVENAARFGARFAVTGEYDLDYCADANAALGWDTSVYDGYEGDPIDCVVPRAADSANFLERTRMLVDWARLPSIRDAARRGAAGMVTDDAAEVSQPGFLEVMVCSHPSSYTDIDYDFDPVAPPECHPVEDPGDPGNPVLITVFFNHPLLVPFLGPAWPHLSLVGNREMIVETFRTPRSLGLPMPIVTATAVPTGTATVESPFGATPTGTAMPACDGLSFLTDWDLFMSGNSKFLEIDIDNQSGVAVTLDRIIFTWGNYEQFAPDQHIDKLFFHTKSWDGSWYDSPLDTGPGVDDDLNDTASATLQIRFGDNDGDWSGTHYVAGDFGINIMFTNGCILYKPVTVIPPTVTPTITPTPPDLCDNLTIDSFFVDGQKVYWLISNGSPTTATITGIDLNWPDDPNDLLDKIELGGDAIWDLKDFDPPTSINSGWKGGVSRSIGPSASKWLMAQFGSAASPALGDYTLEVTFENTCMLSPPGPPAATPTATLDPACSGISYASDWQFSMDRDKKILEIDVRNDSGERIDLDLAVFYWGNYDMYAPEQGVETMELGGVEIFRGNDLTSPSNSESSARINDNNTRTFYVKFKEKDGAWSGTDYVAGDFGLRLEFDNGCNLLKPVTYMDRPTATPVPTPPSGPEGIIWLHGSGSEGAWATVQWHTNPDGSVTIKTTFSKSFVDNTYGDNAMGWELEDGHTFRELWHSDHVRIAFVDLDNNTFFDAKVDFFDEDTMSTGGVTSDNGEVYIGDAGDVNSVRTSLSENFNTLGCNSYTEHSPLTDEDYTPPAACPGWDYNVWYEITLHPDAFPAGFSYPVIETIHASPSKLGISSIDVGIGPTPTPLISPTPTPTENICGDC